MKKLLYLIPLVVSLFCVCCEDPAPEPKIELSKQSLTFDPNGGTLDVIVKSNYDWSLQGTSDWCTPSMKSGSASAEGVTVTFSAPLSHSNRSATFTFVCGTAQAQLTVAQGQVDTVMSSSENTFTVSANGGVIILGYKTNVECEVIIPDEAKEWISIAAGKALVDNSVKLEVAANDTYSARSATIKVQAQNNSSLVAEYTINQVQNNAIISGSENIVSFTAEGGTATLDYQTNVECKVVIPDDAKSWITITGTKALSDHSVTLDIAENKTYSARSAIVKVVMVGDNSVVAEYTINQAQNDAIVAGANRVQIAGYVTSATIEYQTNVECEVIIPDEAKEWLSLAPATATRALTQQSATFDVENNNSGAERSAVVKVVAKDNSELVAEYTIVQNPRYYIEYTTTDGNIVNFVNSSISFLKWKVVSNTYENGIGIIELDEPATHFHENVFRDCTTLKTIVIPESVTRIENYAVAGCTSLTNIVIPESVTDIYQGAFSYCPSLTNIFIPNSVRQIRLNAFDECSSLKSLVIPDSAEAYSSGYDKLFPGLTSLETLILGDGITGKFKLATLPNLKTLEIGDGFTTIESYACMALPNLEKVVIGNGVTTIGDSAFKDCTKLKDLTIGSSVQSINGFENCTSLEVIDIPDSVTSIGSYAFKNCSGVKHITIGKNIVSMGNLPFEGCTGELIMNSNIPSEKNQGNGIHGKFEKALFTKVTIGEGVTTIGDQAFFNCSMLKSVTISDSVTEIRDWAFGYCTSMESLILGKGVKSFYDLTFRGCTGTLIINSDIDVYRSTNDGDRDIESSFDKVVFAEGVKWIRDYQYQQWLGIKSIEIGESVTTIGASAFSDCVDVESVKLGNNIKSIGWGAFAGCTNLREANIPNKLTVIPERLFYRTNLESVVISDSVTEIGEQAFIECSKLKSITLGTGLSFIDGNAFADCVNLKEVHVTDLEALCSIELDSPESSPFLEGNASLYLNGEMVTELVIPESITSIGKYRFWGLSGIKSLIIGKGVTKIGKYAFSYCPDLETIEIGENVATLENAFSQCPKLTSIYFRPTTPPNGYISMLSNTHFTFYVPASDDDSIINAYKDWAQYGYGHYEEYEFD